MGHETERGVAFVTGATSGLGKAIASRLSAGGWTVVGTGRSPVRGAGSEGRQPRLVPMDVLSLASVEAAVADVLGSEGRIDLLVACAGMGIAGSVEDCSMEEIERQMDVNFLGTVRTVRACLPALRASRGRIVVIGSLAGRIAMPFQAFYSSSKFALEGFVECLRYEVRPFGIQACIVEPGDFRTGFTDSRAKSALGSRLYGEAGSRVLAKQEHDERHGFEPEVLAEALIRLLGRRRLPVRRSVGQAVARLGAFLKRIVPASWFEAFYSLYYGVR